MLAWASLAVWSCWEVAGAEVNSGVALERDGGRRSFTATLSNRGYDENDISSFAALLLPLVKPYLTSSYREIYNMAHDL